jgi:uncharacterized protein (DUF2141 family)
MIRKGIIIVFLSIGLPALALNVDKDNCKLTITIDSFGNNKGKVLVALLDDRGNKLADYQSRITNFKSEFIIDGLAASNYAIRCFHNENNNDKSDNNPFGIS